MNSAGVSLRSARASCSARSLERPRRTSSLSSSSVRRDLSFEAPLSAPARVPKRSSRWLMALEPNRKRATPANMTITDSVHSRATPMGASCIARTLSAAGLATAPVAREAEYLGRQLDTRRFQFFGELRPDAGRLQAAKDLAVLDPVLLELEDV